MRALRINPSSRLTLVRAIRRIIHHLRQKWCIRRWQVISRRKTEKNERKTERCGRMAVAAGTQRAGFDWLEDLAERGRFELPIPFRVWPLSRRLVSTTHAPLRARFTGWQAHDIKAGLRPGAGSAVLMMVLLQAPRRGSDGGRRGSVHRHGRRVEFPGGGHVLGAALMVVVAEGESNYIDRNALLCLKAAG